LIFLLIHLCGCSSSLHDPIGDADWVEIRVDPAVELFCVIHRLAGTPQYTEDELSGYIGEIEARFGSFRKHPAVQLATELRSSHHINGSAPMALAVYLEAPPQLNPRNTLVPPPGDLDVRWTADIIPEFIAAAAKFAADTHFMEFFDSHKTYYQQSIQSLAGCLKTERMYPWFQHYFTHEPENFAIIIGMQNGYGNYGLSITRRDGCREFISIMGAGSPSWWSSIPRFSFSWFIPTVVHEFCHSYINPLVEQHDDKLKQAGAVLYPSHETKMRAQGYSSYRIMLNEYLVRACVIRYLHSKDDRRAVDQRIEIDQERGFSEIRGLVDLLEEYESNRDRYRTLGDFMPKIADYFTTCAAQFH
jgi:hypothetical protein